jgi:hypothetical protein
VKITDEKTTVRLKDIPWFMKRVFIKPLKYSSSQEPTITELTSIRKTESKVVLEKFIFILFNNNRIPKEIVKTENPINEPMSRFLTINFFENPKESVSILKIFSKHIFVR